LGLQVALAGSLDFAHLEILLRLQPDIIGRAGDRLRRRPQERRPGRSGREAEAGIELILSFESRRE